MTGIGRYADAVIPAHIEGILDSMRWQVLTFDINVGALVRHVINYLLARINERHISLFNNDLYLLDEIFRLKDQVQAVLDAPAAMLSDVVDRLRGIEQTLVTFLDVNSSPLRDRYETWHQPSKNLLLELTERVQWLSGEVAEEDPPWWRPDQIFNAITTGIGNIISPGGETEDDAKNLFQWLWIFFRDPPEFLYSMADEIITRYW